MKPLRPPVTVLLGALLSSSAVWAAAPLERTLIRHGEVRFHGADPRPIGGMKYYNQNSTLLDPKPVRDYVSPDGMWAVVPCIGDKEWVIIHNGSVLSDVSRTFQSALSAT